jgi:serine O-acetyltransferase
MKTPFAGKRMFEYIRADIRHFNRSQPTGMIKTLKLIWATPALKTLMVYRLGHWLRLVSKSRPEGWFIIIFIFPLYKLLKLYFCFAYDIFLDQSAEIGPGFYIGHFGGIRLFNCIIGENCSIQREVNLGSQGRSNKGPIIGNGVWIGAHVRIQGSVKIGAGATIGAGAIVTQDVDDRCLILGSPARVVRRGYDNSYIL